MYLVILLFLIIGPEILLAYKPSPRQAAELVLSLFQLDEPRNTHARASCARILTWIVQFVEGFLNLAGLVKISSACWLENILNVVMRTTKHRINWGENSSQHAFNRNAQI